MTSFRRVVFNGKFYSGSLNGVHRVSDRLIRECDALLAARDPSERPECALLAPASSGWVPQLSAITVQRVPRTGIVWEQFALPLRSRGGLLVNLANVAPIMAFNKLTMIHDVQFMFRDCGYTARQRFGYQVLIPLVGRSSRSVLTVSDYSRRMLDLCRVAREDRIHVVPNGADHILEAKEDEAFSATLGLEDCSYVVLFGSPKPYKNNKVVFDAFADDALDPLKLVVVGARREALQQAGLQPPERAIFAGSISDGQLRPLLARARALTFPSRTEGFGLPPVEAMLCGCPVVAAPAGAIPEVCGDAAFYAGTDRPEEWRSVLQALAPENSLRLAKIEAGLTQAQDFTWRRAGQILLAIIEQHAAR